MCNQENRACLLVQSFFVTKLPFWFTNKVSQPNECYLKPRLYTTCFSVVGGRRLICTFSCPRLFSALSTLPVNAQQITDKNKKNMVRFSENSQHFCFYFAPPLLSFASTIAIVKVLISLAFLISLPQRLI